MMATNKNVNLKNRRSLIPSMVLVFLSPGFLYAVSQRDDLLKIGYVNSSTILSLFPTTRNVLPRLNKLVQD